MKKESTPHPFYGRRLLTQRLLNQREREASIKPTATIGMNKGLDPGGRKRALYLNDTRTVSDQGCRTVAWPCLSALWLVAVHVPVLLRVQARVKLLCVTLNVPLQNTSCVVRATTGATHIL